MSDVSVGARFGRCVFDDVFVFEDAVRLALVGRAIDAAVPEQAACRSLLSVSAPREHRLTTFLT